MSTPERQQDPGEYGYGGVEQESSADDEREVTPQEAADEKGAERRRLSEERSESEAVPAVEPVQPTDEVVDPGSEDDPEVQGSGNPVI